MTFQLSSILKNINEFVNLWSIEFIGTKHTVALEIFDKKKPDKLARLFKEIFL